MVSHGLSAGDSTTVFPKLGRNMIQVRDILEAAIRITKYRLNLAEIDNRRRHKTNKIEAHLVLKNCEKTPNFSIALVMELSAPIARLRWSNR